MADSRAPPPADSEEAAKLRTQIRIVLTIAFLLHYLGLTMLSAEGQWASYSSFGGAETGVCMLGLALTAIGAVLVAATHRYPWAWRQLWVLMLLWSALGAVACTATLWEELVGGRVLPPVRWKVLLIGSLPFPLQPFLVSNIAHFRRARRLERDARSETVQ